MSVNFAELMKMAGPIEPIPPAEYDVVCKTAEATNTKDGTKPMIKCKFAIENGPHAGRTVYWNATVSQENKNALRIFFTQMDALGLGSTFFNASPTPEQVAQNLVGRRARFTIMQRTYQGKIQPDVKQVSPPLGAATGGFPPPQQSPAAVASPAPAPAPAVATPAPAPVAAPPIPDVPAIPDQQTPTGVDIGEGTAIPAPTGGVAPPAVPF